MTTRGRNAVGALLASGALLCALPFLAQPGSDIPQQSPEAIEAQRDVAPVSSR